MEQNLWQVWDIIKYVNIHAMGVLEWRERKEEKTFWQNNSQKPDLMRNINQPTQETRLIEIKSVNL